MSGGPKLNYNQRFIIVVKPCTSAVAVIYSLVDRD